MMANSILDPQLASPAGLEVILGMQPSPESDALVDALLDMECKVYPAKSPEDALAKLQFHAFQVVILEENYSLEIIGFLSSLPMAVRRNMFYILIGDSLETGNMQQSYVLSANLVVSRTDIATFPQLFTNFFLDNSRFYRPLFYGLQARENKACNS